MEDKSIVEGNKLINSYMQAPVDLNGVYHYHTSWDKLVPVIEKIEKDYHTILHDKRFTISNADRLWDDRGSTKIEAAWKTVVQFVRWYLNQTQKQHE